MNNVIRFIVSIPFLSAILATFSVFANTNANMPDNMTGHQKMVPHHPSMNESNMHMKNERMMPSETSSNMKDMDMDMGMGMNMYNMPGSWIIRGGSARVSPTNDSDVATVINKKIKADSDTQLGVSITYMFTEHMGLELLASTPFKHTLKQKEDDVNIGTVKLLPPTLTAEYYFASPDKRWQPYIGIGVNYTGFFSKELDKGLETTYKDLDLEDSIGLAGQAGIDFYINQNWLVNVSVMYADIKTKATIKPIKADDEKIKVTTDLDPWIYRINIGYHF